ncbi:hypothetical protein [Virgibacillus sp. JSM 102003]|uniref:hypothetical protein n=1 Tax=Virgibacillus sp. JSM 102003 TaxID=1562108 RepID=UPI0035C11A2F
MRNETELKRIEELELKYLNKYYYFMKFALDEMLNGFKTKYKIKSDWIDKWNPDDGEKGISDFATGAERIVYSHLNGKGIGQPNSSPIGSDLFFEVDDAFIHIDLKTVQTRNIGDYTRDIFVGNNQNSYKGTVEVSGNDRIYEEAALPTYYTINNDFKKPCLTYFITILYEEENLQIINMNILCMPNGELNDVYGKRILKAGKIRYPQGDPKRDTHSKTIRYKWAENINFEMLNNAKRMRVIYFNQDIDEGIKSKLSFIEDIYNKQGSF